MKFAFMKFCISTEFGNVKVGLVWRTTNKLFVFIVKLPFWVNDGTLGLGGKVGGIGVIIVHTEGYPVHV